MPTSIDRLRQTFVHLRSTLFLVQDVTWSVTGCASKCIYTNAFCLWIWILYAVIWKGKSEGMEMHVICKLSVCFFVLYILLINIVYVFEWLIFRLNSIRFNFILVISFKLIILMFLVILISWIIWIYKIRYMDLNNEYLINLFYYLTLLFLILIILSISRSNILTLLLG